MIENVCTVLSVNETTFAGLSHTLRRVIEEVEILIVNDSYFLPSTQEAVCKVAFVDKWLVLVANRTNETLESNRRLAALRSRPPSLDK